MKPIANAPGYWVTSDGVVYSDWKANGPGPYLCDLSYRHPLKPILDSVGYQCVGIRQNSRRHMRRIHQILLESYVGPKPEGMVARHLDGDPTNNHLDNLVWGSYKENAEDTVRHGRSTAGSKHSLAKVTIDLSKQVLTLRSEGKTQREIAERTGINQATVSHILTGKHWTVR